MKFQYTARTQSGEARAGTLEARSRDAAVEALQRADLVITAIRPVEEAAGLALFGRRISFRSRVRQRDLVIFSRQLSTLFEAKVPITRSLQTLGAESPSTALRATAQEILEDVSGGSSLSQAMARHPGVFSRFIISMVRAGEESGKLEAAFLYLAGYLDRNYVLILKTRNAMIYPAFVFATFIGVVGVLLVVVIPKLTAIYAELGQAAPFYTQLVISVSTFLARWWFLVVLALASAAAIAWRLLRTEVGALWFDALKIKLPFIGGLAKKVYLTRLTDTLSTLIAAGIPIIRALEITADVVVNRVYAAIVLDAAESVKAGNTISSSFEKHREIPPLVTQMIRVGEESGRLDFILKSSASFYQREVDNLLDNFVALIEPALIIFLGIGVALLVAAVLVPLYNLTSII